MSQRMPVRDRRIRVLLALTAAADRLPTDKAWSALILLLAAIGIVDRMTGPAVSLTIFYAAAIVFASWRLGRFAGYASVAATVLLSFMANLRHSGVGPADLSAAAGWNIAANAIGAILMMGLVVTLRATIDHERLRAATDPLTGVLNRGAFFERLAAAAGGADCPLLACVDLDGFKGVNDERGHAAGDRLLRDFARGVAEALGERELIARIGGDEFALLVTLAPGEDPPQRARRLHRHLSDVLARGRHGVTCSIGLTTMREHRGTPLDALLALADTAMYEVKRSGRDGVRLAGEAARATAAPGQDAPSLRLVGGDGS